MTSRPVNTVAPYLQTSVFFPEEFAEFRVKFLDLYRDISNNVNIRQIAIFDLQEFLTGEQWFVAGNPQRTRQTFRKTYLIPAPLAAVNTIAHNLGTVNSFTFTHIYGTVNNQTAPLFAPIPQGGANTSMIEVNGTNIVVTLPAAYQGANFFAIIVLEYLKN